MSRPPEPNDANLRREVAPRMRAWATFSATEAPLYRYDLGRRLDGLFSERKTLLVCGLNPSKAGAFRSDVTITKECGFAERLGCKQLVKVNLYGLVSTDPAGLFSAEDPIGPENDALIANDVRWLERPCDLILTLVAWGSHAMATPERIAAVTALLPKPLMCLGTTLDGQPRHPSRIAYATPVVPWSVRA